MCARKDKEVVSINTLLIFFLGNLCCENSLESSHHGNSNEYSKCSKISNILFHTPLPIFYVVMENLVDWQTV